MYRMNIGIISELVNIKKNDKGKDEIAWGILILIPIVLGLVNQYSQKDNIFALMILTVYNRKSKITKVWKRPKKTSSKVKTVCILFRD